MRPDDGRRATADTIRVREMDSRRTAGDAETASSACGYPWRDGRKIPSRTSAGQRPGCGVPPMWCAIALAAATLFGPNRLVAAVPPQAPQADRTKTQQSATGADSAERTAAAGAELPTDPHGDFPAEQIERDRARTITLTPQQRSAAWKEANLALRGFQIPTGMSGRVVAAEPLTANIVAFCLDDRGRIYVAETYRQEHGVEDNRSHRHWLLEDLQLQTVEQRRAMFARHLGPKLKEYTKLEDLVRRLEDTDGDGFADRATVFAGGFRDVVDGTGAGVLARGNEVYYTCIPRLWLLRDEDDDGVAEVRRSLLYGFGVRVAFRGHDMHGLVEGPDGRLYFSIGDRGFHVVTRENRILAMPDQGAVFRCNWDGTGLEVVASGLRNPQELAFDDFGNLFTVDNNSDSGDRARVVYVVPGGDSGWRMYFQYLPDRGPWNRERMWHPFGRDAQTTRWQPAFIVPPLENLSDGPSGLAAYPGIGLPPRYRNHLFLCDFRGTASRSGIRSFALRPRGASFEVIDQHQFLWSILATDVDFDFRGGVYVSDWINGWTGVGKGRIYRFEHATHAAEAARAGAEQLVRQGFGSRSAEELLRLLSHPDRRVRQRAHSELARRRDLQTLQKAVAGRNDRTMRLHALWGLWQVGRVDRQAVAAVLSELLGDPDDEIRAQAARVVADVAVPVAAQTVIARLEDRSARVRFFAALAAGRVCGKAAVEPLLGLLQAAEELQDPYLRHAAVMGLLDCARSPELLERLKDLSPAQRLGVALVLRRRRDPRISRLLFDPDPRVVWEVARAINDVPIDPATAALAAVPVQPGSADLLVRRVLNANFRLGEPEHAARVVAIAARDGFPEALRLEALQELEMWEDPPVLDRVTGAYRPLPQDRQTSFIRPMLAAVLPSLLQGSEKIQRAATSLAARYGIRDIEPAVVRIIEDPSRSPTMRAAALAALATLDSPRLGKLTRRCLESDAPELRAAALRVAADRKQPDTIELIERALKSGTTRELQVAFEILGDLAARNDARANALIGEWMQRLFRGDVPAGAQLELLEAASRAADPRVRELRQRYERERAAADAVTRFRECLEGGDPQKGAEIFFSRSEASCRRCHTVAGSGGAVGPDLTKIGADKPAEYLLEAVVDPNKTIAKGFETVVIATVEGKVVSGIVKEETPQAIKLTTPEGVIHLIDKNDIEERIPGKSAMPADLVKHLSRRDIRDLVAFLKTLKGSGAAAGEESSPPGEQPSAKRR